MKGKEACFFDCKVNVSSLDGFVLCTFICEDSLWYLIFSYIFLFVINLKASPPTSEIGGGFNNPDNKNYYRHSMICALPGLATLMGRMDMGIKCDVTFYIPCHGSSDEKQDQRWTFPMINLVFIAIMPFEANKTKVTQTTTVHHAPFVYELYP